MLPAPAMKLSSSKSATKTPAEAGKTSFGISANSRLSMTGMRLSIHLLMPQVIPSKVCTSLAIGGISACLSGKSAVYAFTLSVPMEVVVSHCGSALSDTCMHLLDASKNLIVSNDDYSGEGRCSNSYHSYIKRQLAATVPPPPLLPPIQLYHGRPPTALLQRCPIQA